MVEDAESRFPLLARIRCPRCDAEGLVYRSPIRGRFTVEWRSSRGGWSDTGVLAEDLRMPDFGCGFDLPEDDPEWQGPPVF